MTMFDQRERAFENLFAHDEELRFLALARRNHLFACWAAEHLELRASEFRAYVRSFVDGVVRPQSEEALIARVRADFLAERVETSDERIRAALVLASSQAARQVRTVDRPVMPQTANEPSGASALA